MIGPPSLVLKSIRLESQGRYPYLIVLHPADRQSSMRCALSGLRKTTSLITQLCCRKDNIGNGSCFSEEDVLAHNKQAGLRKRMPYSGKIWKTNKRICARDPKHLIDLLAMYINVTEEGIWG